MPGRGGAAAGGGCGVCRAASTAAIEAAHADLGLGLVDAVVTAVAERIGASAIATLDPRHLGAVKSVGTPRFLPRDELPEAQVPRRSPGHR